LPFDYQGFDAVARVLVESPVIAVRADAKWKTLNDLVAEAKSRPKAVSVGHSGIGSHTHLCLAALFHAAGVEMNEVPFGAAQVVPSLIGGHVDALVQLPAALAGPVKQGQVRLIAELTPNRDPALADVPTAREQGIDVALEAWRGIAVPRGRPGSGLAAASGRLPPAAALSRFFASTAGGRGTPAFASCADCLADLVASAINAAHGLSLSLPSCRSGSTASSGLSTPITRAPAP